MTPEYFKELLNRYTRGECNKEEKRYVEEWYASLSSDNVTIPENLEGKLWMKVKPAESSQPRNNKQLYLKIAASLVILVLASAWFYLQSSVPFPGEIAGADRIETTQLVPAEVKTEIRNDTKVAMKVSLEDGSVITLQPESSLSLPEKFSERERVVSLQGEAFFDIQRDTLRPFYVYSREVVTKVLGTSFNIKARDSDKEITVAVKTGKVSVFTNPKIKKATSPEVILTPNQQAVYDRNDIVVTKQLVEKPEVILAKPTIFQMQYEETPVTEIFKVLEQNYGVDIDFDEEVYRSCVLTTKMSNEGLFERVEVICKAIGSTYTLDNAVIRIEGKGCK
jgi:transmembrane sensor